jgi:UMF2 family putative MFS family transporter
MTALLMQHYSDQSLFVMIAAVALVYLMMLLKKPDPQHTPLAAA